MAQLAIGRMGNRPVPVPWHLSSGQLGTENAHDRQPEWWKGPPDQLGTTTTTCAKPTELQITSRRAVSNAVKPAANPPSIARKLLRYVLINAFENLTVGTLDGPKVHRNIPLRIAAQEHCEAAVDQLAVTILLGIAAWLQAGITLGAKLLCGLSVN